MEGFALVRLAFTTHEPGCGADKNLSPVIFLHGLGAFKETWEDVPQTVANATKRLCYSVDSRNHGDSEWSDEFSVDLNVNDLIHFMDTHGIKKAILVGHSMGGITAIRTALKEPNRVEKIVVEDIFPQKLSQVVMDMILEYHYVMRQAIEEAPADLDEDGMKKFVMQHTLAHLPPEMKKQFLTRIEQDPDRMMRLISLKRGANGRYTYKYNLEVTIKAVENKKIDSIEPKGVFDNPTFFVFGKMSPYYEMTDKEKMNELFPKAIVEVIEDVGHDIHLAKPQEFINIVLKFLS